MFTTSCNPIRPNRHAAPTGQSSATRPANTLRRALLMSVAAGAMMLGHTAQAQVTPSTTDKNAPCYSEDGTTVTCTGDVSGGIVIDNGSGIDTITAFDKNLVANHMAGEVKNFDPAAIL